ncbi:MAG: hypothetical protein M3081_20300 [Gemmatimonadota bacterium]|nr:hypothetical protein [Gemmatimonadota bacterium]
MLRSVGVVLLAYVAMVVVVMVGTAIAAAALLPNGLATMKAPPPGPVPTNYLSASLVVALFAAVFAGWIVVRLASSNPWQHAVGLSALIVVMGIISGRMTPGNMGQPKWYPWVIPLIGVAGVAIGVATRTRM